MPGGVRASSSAAASAPLGKLSTARNGRPVASSPRRSSVAAAAGRNVSLPNDANTTAPSGKEESQLAHRSSSSPCGGSGTTGPARSTGLPNWEEM